MSQLRSLLRLTRPIHLFLALLTYTLGLGIAHYLGSALHPEAQFLGGAIVILLLAASGLFVASFRPFNEPIIQGETRGEREALRRLLLAFGVAFLAVASVFFFLLQRAGFIHLDSGFLLAVFAMLALANAIPPVRLSNRGFGEIVDAFLIASLTPTLAFFLQTGIFHRLLTLFTFPLFLIFLACFLALNFPAYADDLKYERRSLLMALTWQQAVPIHNLLLIAAYLLLAAGPFFAISFGLVWPALLTLPLAAYQIFALRNIANGAAPLWNVFKITAFAIMGLATYLLAVAFWLN
jgi:1,4-dihydroxy-2-naphthoate octaprenyltransferase